MKYSFEVGNVVNVYINLCVNAAVGKLESLRYSQLSFSEIVQRFKDVYVYNLRT